MKLTDVLQTLGAWMTHMMTDHEPYLQRLQWQIRNMLLAQGTTPIEPSAPIPPCPGCK